MFLLVLVLLATALGLRRGSLAHLADVSVRGLWVPLTAFTAQSLLVHFPVVSPSTSAMLGPLVIVVTYAAVIVFLAVNRLQPGVKLAALGACLNLAVMLANGGYMPVTLAALERSGHLDRRVVRDNGVYVSGSKDVVLEDSEIRLGFLADALSLPRPIPLAASFSLGDVFIAAGASTFAYKTVSRPRARTGVVSPRVGGIARGGSGGFQGRGDRWRYPMLEERMHRLIGRALTDPRFRERLLRSPAEAIRDLPLTRSERSLVASLRAASLEEFSRKLDEKLRQGEAQELVTQRLLPL
jgi:hypothetical protein